VISVIIPIYNRAKSLDLVLTALDCQGFRDFEVIVSDDGSVDDPEAFVAYYKDLMPMVFITHPHEGFGANKCRNAGAAMAQGEALVFLDSDILLNCNALQHYWNLYTGSGRDKIIGGRYDWLPPMKITPMDVVGSWQAIVEGRLPRTQSWDRLELKGIIGVDPRELKFPGFFDHQKRQVRHDYCLELYGGNMLVPREIFHSLGGFDEAMNRHGGEDCEFAIRAQSAGWGAIFAAEPIGYHMYHDRNQVQNEIDVAANIEYMRQKHDFVALGLVEGKNEQLPLIREEQ